MSTDHFENLCMWTTHKWDRRLKRKVFEGLKRRLQWRKNKMTDKTNKTNKTNKTSKTSKTGKINDGEETESEPELYRPGKRIRYLAGVYVTNLM